MGTALHRTDEIDPEELAVEDVDETDQVLIARGRPGALMIEFSVTLSPTYGVPVLWFAGSREADNRPLDLPTVYECMVPATSQGALQQVGVMGAISMGYHPISDRPAFFVHPCRTAEALLALHPQGITTSEEYLLLWLGIIGASVGLHVPSQVLTARS